MEFKVGHRYYTTTGAVVELVAKMPGGLGLRGIVVMGYGPYRSEEPGREWYFTEDGNFGPLADFHLVSEYIMKYRRSR